jgi:hypothetical protein
MTTFRTDVSVSRSPYLITQKTAILTAGSCFADAIGQRLYKYKFPTLVNPFGVIYNPPSIHKLLLKAICNEPPAPHTFLQHGDVHLNFDFHSEFSAVTKEDLSNTITNSVGTVHYFLQSTAWILLTYGTAWVYERKDCGEVVANCHKKNAQDFSKRLLSEAEIVSSFQLLHQSLKQFNPATRVILTVSPVRHIKDTLELNSVSKAVVRTACHTIVSKFSDTEYFPAYEMMLDDLRDYRFYKSDMLHPTEDAEEYIWNKFAFRYFDEETNSFIGEWNSIVAALNHKPFNPGSASHQQFLQQTLKKLERFKNKIDIEKETDFIKKQLL